MTAVEQLTFQCMQWRVLLQKKEERYSSIKDPLKRIIPAIHLINIRMELAMMEDELCRYLLLPTSLIKQNDQYGN